MKKSYKVVVWETDEDGERIRLKTVSGLNRLVILGDDLELTYNTSVMDLARIFSRCSAGFRSAAVAGEALNATCQDFFDRDAFDTDIDGANLLDYSEITDCELAQLGLADPEADLFNTDDEEDK